MQIPFILLLTLASVWANDGIKNRIGQEFGEALKKYNAELLKSNMESLKTFYKTISDISLSPRDERAFNMRLDSIELMQNRIGDSVTPESVKMIRDFTKIVLFEMMMFRASQTIARDPEKSQAFDAAMKKSADDEIEHLDTLIDNMQNKWNDLYETIPKDELEAHDEYNEINNSIEQLSKMDRSFSGVVPRAIAFAETLRKVSTFFDYSEWDSILFKNDIRNRNRVSAELL